jgi:Transglycosylase SLT domain
MIFQVKYGMFRMILLNSLLLNLKRFRLQIAVFLSVFGLVISPAQADVWGYIDAKGVAHFASEKVDDRYELFFKGGTGAVGFDTREGIAALSKPEPQREPDTPRQVGVPAGQSKLIAFFEVSPNFKAVKHHMREASAAHNIDFELLQALIATESGFDTKAVSPKGAVGLMQLMAPTAQRYGVKAEANLPIEKKLTDPKTNIKAGTRYLRDLINMFPGKLELALAAYNAGEGAVQRYGNKIPPFKETQNYVVTVMQIYNQLKPPAAIAQRQQQNLTLPPSPSRVRMAFPGQLANAAPGQIAGRGNMVPSLRHVPLAPDDRDESKQERGNER